METPPPMPASRQRTIAELEEENALLHGEILVARRASDLTAQLVVEQFQRLEEIMRRLEENLATELELRQELAARLRVEEQQRQEISLARNAAEAANAAKSSFLAATSHELRTPLTSVLGFSKIIQKKFSEVIVPAITHDDRKVGKVVRQIEENLQIIITEGLRLTNLINNVLDLAKIESGRIEWKIETITIPEIINQSTAATASLFEGKPLQLTVEIGPDLPEIQADRDRLVQVLINLIANAVKFTEQGEITCRALRKDAHVLVQVSDTGIGIAPEDQHTVFEKFFQASDTLSGKPAGTGLGLAICKQIVEHYGGHIWVESEQGQGSTFSFLLPLSSPGPLPDLEAPARPSGGESQQPRLAGPNDAKRLLIVDDEANIRELIRQELEGQGYHILCAAGGRTALQLAREKRPDLILLDLMLPDINGYEVLASLKADPNTRAIPVVIVSILEDKEKGFQLGADAYFIKPLNSVALLREIHRLLREAGPTDPRGN
ncbi:MAG: ATP-binding protein [Thermodesulfobacteriota bacterium]